MKGWSNPRVLREVRWSVLLRPSAYWRELRSPPKSWLSDRDPTSPSGHILEVSSTEKRFLRLPGKPLMVGNFPNPWENGERFGGCWEWEHPSRNSVWWGQWPHGDKIIMKVIMVAAGDYCQPLLSRAIRQESAYIISSNLVIFVLLSLFYSHKTCGSKANNWTKVPQTRGEPRGQAQIFSPLEPQSQPLQLFLISLGRGQGAFLHWPGERLVQLRRL